MKYIIGIDEVGRAASKRRASPHKYIIGIDEVGRGSIAGPVTVAALALPRNFRFPRQTKLKDSKQLSAKQRELWFAFIKKQRISFAIGSISPKLIDRINISRAANLAATRAFKKLMFERQPENCRVFLDGGLYLRNSKKPFEKGAKTVIKGDEKIDAIKLASIVAKVHRDRLMKRWHKKIPAYGFHRHKGYGTKRHFTAIRRHGPSRIHRLTFLRKVLK